MYTKETITKIEELQKMSDKLTEEITMEVLSICGGLKWKDASKFSYNIDRINKFNKSLQEFKITNQ